ncbi:MAG: hypothetical protein WC445_03705 [Patescibacteria group bacterium]
MESIKKLNCPHCGQGAECLFSGRKVDSVFLKDEYVVHCPACGWQETKSQHAGHHIGNRDFPQGSTCPFCGKSSDGHAKRLPLGEISRRFREREGMDGQLHTPPRGQESPAAGSVSEQLLEIDVTLEPAVCAITPNLPPRAKTQERQMKTWKFLTRWSTRKLMNVFMIVYTLVLGTLVFTTKLWDEAPVGAAFQATLFPIAIITAWMIICSALIVRYSRKHYGEP